MQIVVAYQNKGHKACKSKGKATPLRGLLQVHGVPGD